jgi:hypothetical protein
MTLPLLTWRQSALYGGAIATVAAHLAALNTMVAAEAALGGEWSVNHYDAVNGELELKLANPADSTVAKIRVLFFGGAIPHVDAVDTGNTRYADTIYCYVALDGNTSGTGPTVLYTAGDPYPSPGCTLKTKGFSFCGSVTSYASDRMEMYQCAEAFMIRVGGSSGGTVTCTFGRLLDDGSANGRWIRMLSNGHIGSAGGGDASQPGAYSSFWMVPGYYETPGYSSGVAILESGVNYTIGRISNDLTNNYGLIDPTLGGVFMSIPMLWKIRFSASANTYAGTLRQLRYGPTLNNRTAAYSGATLAGYAVACNVSTAIPVYLDQAA